MKVLPLLVAVVLVAFAAFSAWYIYMYVGVSNAMRSYDATSSKTCREGYTEGMPAEEVSALMQIPLIRFNWLPKDAAEVAPQILPHGLPHFDDSGGVTCVIRITYPEFFADILAPQSNRISSGVRCYENDGLTSCWGEIETSNGYSAVSMFTNYPVEVAQKIADGIELV